ncbi:MAG TPA: hypothetical protein VH988_15645 [Thermoanaerobaculia bacterium]|jgi:hypothetical protein|nr:hypothetical protein [Thermoanaerobaculia bacterium]
MDIDPFDTILYQSPRVTVSRFSAHPSEPRFHDSGPARFDCFVFRSPASAFSIPAASRSSPAPTS